MGLIYESRQAISVSTTEFMREMIQIEIEGQITKFDKFRTYRYIMTKLISIHLNIGCRV